MNHGVVVLNRVKTDPDTSSPIINPNGKMRTVSSYLLFSSGFVGHANDIMWKTKLVTGGTATHDSNGSLMNLTVTTSNGSRVVRQSGYYAQSQPGGTIVARMSGVFPAAQTNTTCRIGYFDDNDGVFLEQVGSTVQISIRSSVTGITHSSVARASWNDPLTGSGASGKTLDLTKAINMIVELQWPVGILRIGFEIDGIIVYAHTFNFSNAYVKPYMKSGNLPIRWEIVNTGAAGATRTLVCMGGEIRLESDHPPIGYIKAVSLGDNSQSIGTTLSPLVSCRLTSGMQHFRLLVRHMEMVCTSGLFNNIYRMVLVLNGTLSGASWSAQTNSIMDADTSATAISGGTHLYTVYGNGTTVPIDLTIPLSNISFGMSVDMVADIVSLCGETISGSVSGIASMVMEQMQ